jgi:hypothetical protein
MSNQPTQSTNPCDADASPKQPAPDKETWSKWATNNQNGTETDAIVIPRGNRVTSIEILHQENYGMVNARIHYKDMQGTAGISNWVTNNRNGTSHSTGPYDDKLDVVGMEVKYFEGWGMTDVRLALFDGAKTTYTSWAKDERGDVYSVTVGEKQICDGIRAREEHRYGLVNMRIRGSRK